jgi:hypothetical protein
MFDFCIYEIKPVIGERRSGYYFGIWGVINEINDGDTSEVSNDQLLEWAEQLKKGRAVNYRGNVIRKYSVEF